MKKKLTIVTMAVLFLTSFAGLSGCTTTGSHEMMDDSSKTMHKDTMGKDTMNGKMMEKDDMKSGMSDTMK